MSPLNSFRTVDVARYGYVTSDINDLLSFPVDEDREYSGQMKPSFRKASEKWPTDVNGLLTQFSEVDGT